MRIRASQAPAARAAQTKGACFQRQNLGADHARGRAPQEKDHQQDHEREARFRDRDHHHGEGQERHAERDVGRAHQDLVDPAAEIARNETDERAENDAAERGDETDDQGHARAPDELAEHVHALVGRAEPVLPTRRRERDDGAVCVVDDVERTVRRDQGRERRDGDEDHGDEHRRHAGPPDEKTPGSRQSNRGISHRSPADRSPRRQGRRENSAPA